MNSDLCSYNKELEMLKAVGWLPETAKEMIPVVTAAEIATSLIPEVLDSRAADTLKALQVKVVYPQEEKACHDAVAYLLNTKTTIALDIETYQATSLSSLELHTVQQKKCGLDPHLSDIRLIQFYAGGSTVYVFDVRTLGGLEILAPLFNRPLVAHNAVFELKHLLHKGAQVPRIGCTMLQANILSGELLGLKALAKELLDIDISKEQQTSDWAAKELTQEQIEYAALDAVVTKKIFDIQQARLEEKNLLRAYLLMREAQHAVAELELEGVKFNVDAHATMLKAWEIEKERLEKELVPLLAGVNPASSVQIDAWLREKLNTDDIERWTKTGKGRLKTNAEALGNFAHLDFVKPLLEYKEVAKNISTYGESYAAHVNPVTKRIHANFRLGGTTTGRLSCNNPNIQNPPREKAFRALFCAPEGRKLIVADFSQIELRVAALISKDPTMLQAYELCEDLHRKTAAAVLRIKQEEVTKEQRQMAKAVNFGLLYGQGAKGLSRYAKSSYGVEMSEKEAEQARRAFFKTYQGLKTWQTQTGNMAMIKQNVETLGGRIRDFRREKNGYRFTEALNTPIQGTAAEIMLAAMVYLRQALEQKDAHLVNVVHDEIIVEAAEEIAEEVKEIVERCMVKGFLEIMPGTEKYIKGLVEAHIGNNWAEAK